MSYANFLKNMDNPTIVWAVTLRSSTVVGTLVSYIKDSNGTPLTIMILRSDIGRIVEIPWTAIQIIETEINNG